MARMPAIVVPLVVASCFAQSESFDQIARKADAARQHDQLDEAARLYQRALRLKPSWAEGWWSLGTIYYDSDKHAECVAAFTRFVALKPEVGPAHALLGLCEFGRGDYDAALHQLFEAQRYGFAGDPHIREVSLYHTAVALILKRQFEKALEQLAMLVAASPPGPLVRTAAGLAALRKPLLPERVPEADRPLVSETGDAVILQLTRHTEEAARAFESLLAAHPREPELHYAYGAMLLGSDPAKGLQLLAQELEISPEHVPALASIALEYLKENDPAAARPYAEKAAHDGPSDFVARMAYGRVLLELNDVPRAIAELEAAAKFAPDSPQVHFSLASAYARAGRTAEAANQRKEFLRLQKLLDSVRK